MNTKDALGNELGDYVAPQLTLGQVIKAHRECEDWTLEKHGLFYKVKFGLTPKF